jgi:molybdopterin molybdotransferase
MTGAPVPYDCNAVVKVEDVQRHGEWIEFSKNLFTDQNIRKAGEDFLKDNQVAAPGTRILPEHVMAFSALGIKEVSVYRNPRVAVVSTGAELTDDSNADNAKIRNSTAPYLLNELSSLQTHKKFLGVVADNPKDFLKIMESELTTKPDVIISTGAVSMGRYDFIAPTLRDLGADILFHKVAIRPAKPILFAKIGKTAFFGIPGNPISTVVGLRFFVEPYLRSLQGLPVEKPYQAVLENSFKKPIGMRCFFKARLSSQRSHRTVKILSEQESFRIAPLLNSQCWAVLPEENNQIDEGSEIDIYPLHSYSQKEIL